MKILSSQVHVATIIFFMKTSGFSQYLFFHERTFSPCNDEHFIHLKGSV